LGAVGTIAPAHRWQLRVFANRPQDLRVGAVLKAPVGQMPERRHFYLVARQSSDDDHRVVHLRARRAKADGMARWRGPIRDGNPNISSVLSLAKYERDGHEGDSRQRMIMNGLAFLVTVALIAIGVWLAANIDG
jgi:hypothetical protein